MPLGLGPVVRYELITTARRGRFYLARVAYGLSLLVLLWNQFRDFAARHPAGGTAEQLQTFAEETFIQFAGAQGGALLCLIPALIAGVIADEHQRKTLHYLLASRLSSAEIILGKLGARLVHVATFVALGIPVVCLLALYGGLNPENVLYVYLGTLTMVIFVSGLSIFVSIMARRPRDAILATYALGALWLLVPISIMPVQQFLSGPLWWVRPVNEWVLLTNPMFVWRQATYHGFYVFTLGGLRPSWFMFGFTEIFYWMVGLQTCMGLLLITLAVFGLRPIRGNSWPGGHSETGWGSRLAARARAIAHTRAVATVTQNTLLIAGPTRAPCGDDPMLWKERYTTLGGGLRWLGSPPMVLFFSVLLGCYLLDVARPVVTNSLTGNGHAGSRSEVSTALRSSSAMLAALVLLAVAATGAVSLTGEREQDTWISLATTFVTPAEVVRAKQLGAIWSARRVALAVMVIWAAGMLLGAIHPAGVLAGALYMTTVAWVVAAIGVFASSMARNSTRALVGAFVMLLVFSAITQWPTILRRFLFSYEDVRWSLLQSPFEAFGQFETFSIAVSFATMLAMHIAAGAALTFGSRRQLRATWGR